MSEGALPDDLARNVRPQVLLSWKRSIMSGADLANPALTFRGEHHARAALRLAADPVLSRLADELSGLNAGVLLSDHDAIVVQRWVSDPGILPLMDRINSNVGFCISEESIGTNGVGSVIEQDAAIQVSGPEHLAEALRPFTCVGVPVHHPITRRLEGVITMNCRATSGNPLLTPLMTSTATEVESRLLAQATTSERQLLDEYLVAIGSRRAPVAAVGQDIFIAGPKVTDLLEGVDRAALWEYVRGIALGSGLAADDFGLTTDRFRITRCKPVINDGRIIGALVEFDVDRPAAHEELALVAPPRPTITLPGKSPALVQAIAHATRLAAKGVPILIEGEPGVGKYALARAVLESAHVTADKIAVIDAAAGWAEGATKFVSLLREELENSPEALLLRHLEALTPEAAAASSALLDQFDDLPDAPRIVATMTTGGAPTPGHRRLVDTVGVGRVTLPPLRDRQEDIAPTAVAMLDKHRGPKELRFSSSALRCLMRHSWPGNLRQLDATIRGLLSTSLGPEIRPEALPLDLQGNSRKRDLSAIEELELSAILSALKQHNGNKVAAAQSIGISRSTLYRKLQAYRLDPDKQYF
ncbi:Fis family transcriptional regulator [Nocardioides sp. LS1]|nr:Fis family transcriptional regulator [Nocardioides sp. LS1]